MHKPVPLTAGRVRPSAILRGPRPAHQILTRATGSEGEKAPAQPRSQQQQQQQRSDSHQQKQQQQQQQPRASRPPKSEGAGGQSEPRGPRPPRAGADSPNGDTTQAQPRRENQKQHRPPKSEGGEGRNPSRPPRRDSSGEGASPSSPSLNGQPRPKPQRRKEGGSQQGQAASTSQQTSAVALKVEEEEEKTEASLASDPEEAGPPHSDDDEEPQPDDPFANLPPGFRMPPAARVDFLAASLAANRDPSKLTASEESLDLLDWPAVLKQLAAFCQTVSGYELVRLGRMPMGDSGPEESARLQSETAEALSLLRSGPAWDLANFLEIRPALEAAARDRVLTARQLNGVAQTLAVARAVKESVEGAGGSSLPHLRAIVEGMGDCGDGLVARVRHCIDPTSGLVLDRASDALALVREERRENSALLARTMQQIARELYHRGAAENSNVVIRRDRLCVGVRAGRQGDLTKGSLVLDTSSSGQTLFVEPFEAMELNNTETYLAEEEERETQAVLRALSLELKERADALAALVAAMGRLDLAIARARHALWIRGSRPTVLGRDATAPSPVSIPDMRHPLLLQNALPPLPDRPANFEIEFETEYMGAVGGSAVDKGGKPAFAGTPFPKEEKVKSPAAPALPELGPVDTAALSKPVDLRVPEAKKVAALTGPNTGGKTATLKALGVGALMARCGLYLPAHDPSAAQLAPLPDGSVSVQWFDQVLADIGDGQSLQQSLSTFGGHVRRLRRILASATPQSLVLLDEVGSGTDPKEGAALAVAILEVLAESARFTLATTHHALVKEFATADARFVNASVEFDLATLRPTYRLLWGQAGASNALNVAQALGFDPSVVREARAVYESLTTGGGAGSIQSPDLLLEDLRLEIEGMREKGRAASAERKAAEASLETYQSALAALKAEQEGLRKREKDSDRTVKAFEEEVRAVTKALNAGRIRVEEAEEQMAALSVKIPNASEAVNALVGLKYGGLVAGVTSPEEGARGEEGAEGAGAASTPPPFDPEVNQMVRVLKMGGAIGRITQAPRTKAPTAKFTVRIGTLTTTALLSELAPLSQEDLAAILQQEATGGAFGGGGGGGSRRSDYRQVLLEKAMRGGTKKKEQLSSFKVASGAGIQQSFSSSLNMQTASNTLDLRGCLAAEGISRVDMALSRARSGATIFVVTGVGTGQLRSAILDYLKRDPRVARTEMEEKSMGGCTVVYRK